MSYIHEAKLLSARKKLSMLGSSRDKWERQAKEDQDTYGSIGNAIKSASKSKPKKDADEQAILKRAGNADELQQYQQQSDGTYKDLFDHPNTGPQVDTSNVNWGGQQMPNPISLAQRNQEANSAAKLAPINGSFTKPGFDAHEKETNETSADLATGRRLISGSGMMGTYAPLRPGGF
jgi:hypothetical protein